MAVERKVTFEIAERQLSNLSPGGGIISMVYKSFSYLIVFALGDHPEGRPTGRRPS